MAWVKLDDGFPDHRKLAELGDYAPLCGWLYVCGLAFCNRQLTDGRIPKAHVHRLASFRHIGVETGCVGDPQAPMATMGEDVDVQTLADHLVSVGLWEDAGDAYQVHDYAEYQLTKVEVEAMRAQRVAAGRAGGEASGAKRTAKQVAKQVAEQTASETPSKSSSKTQAKSNPDPDPDPKERTESVGTAVTPCGNVEKSRSAPNRPTLSLDDSPDDRRPKHPPPTAVGFTVVSSIVDGLLTKVGDYAHPGGGADLKADAKDALAQRGLTCTPDTLRKALDSEEWKRDHRKAAP